MFAKLSLFLSAILLSMSVCSQNSGEDSLTDKEIRHIMGTLPRMVPRLRQAGITVSQAYYIWPRDAALHAKGEVILGQYGYDALLLDALETFCKTWFCLNYDNLIAERRQILMTSEEHINENPYVTEDQKRINIRMLNKELGDDKEQLKKEVGENNLRRVRTYENKFKEIWEELD
ncbi:MAG: hypothetical protein PWQ06_1547 [Anaerophaga sp.]|uniref:hypothetical protein n=1 Tax=Anaerophaga thermohalophila TaxID=177400 RepID=UPI000237D55B|nr:hypothetical protein [Anaerophaga thermohalophila]MDN5291308.1 hypothetical protein [Anaerophaga sp.]